MITEQIILERRTALNSELEITKNRIREIDTERNRQVANMNAYTGAIDQCNYFLSLVEGEGEANE
tara:strand:+ start:1638 stop:1832 length:195 start_codon:yes stop_codon:yes gene_type:complete